MQRLAPVSLLLAIITIHAFAETPVADAVEQAHSKLFSTLVDKHGIIRDHVGDLPTPEDCALGKPNIIGWWSPIEDGPMFTGLYLPAACERTRRSGKAEDLAQARSLVHGLIKCASVSEVPGFIARGIGSDDKCHYPMGSDDQTHPWFLGLHTYLTSGLASPDERRQILSKMKEVADVLESTLWRCPADGAFKGQFRGGYMGHLFRDAVRYLYILRAMHAVTGEGVWLERYQKALAERPEKSEKTRAEICEEGFAADRHAIEHIDDHQLWIYVGSQASLAQLAALENDQGIRQHYLKGLVTNANNALPSLEVYRQFDNNDTKLYGNARWREGYPTWFPQLTQADGEKLAKMGDHQKLGTRKNYESTYMSNPLAAAAIIALAGNPEHRTAVEQAIRHYDYSKINMAQFIFAECAFYALPASP